MTIHQHKNKGYYGFPTRFLMRLSTIEGSFAQVHQLLTSGVFLTIMALALGAKPWHLGFIVAIPHLTQIFQLLGAYLVEATGRRKALTIISAALSRALWILVPLLFLLDDTVLAMRLFIWIMLVASALELMAGNAWTTWMADLIPEALRGRYFGFRSSVMAGIAIVTTYLGGLWLEMGSAVWSAPIALSAILIIAVVSGLVGIALLTRQPDIARPVERKAPPFKELLVKPMQSAEFKRALEFFFMWNAAIGFSAAFFNVHMLEVLAVSFTTVGIFHSIKPLAAMLIFRWWGRLLDQFQLRSVLLVCGTVITFLPLLWLLPTSQNISWLWVIAIIAGLSWTGFNLSVYTYPMRYSPQYGRSYYLAYFSIVSSVGFVIAAVAGGLVAQRLTGWELQLGDRTFMVHHVLFSISVLMRIAALFLLLRLKQVDAPGTMALITRIGAGVWRTASLGRPFPRWIRRNSS